MAITKIDRTKVRVSLRIFQIRHYRHHAHSDRQPDPHADGDTPFLVDLDLGPPTLLFDPRNEIAYRGNKQK